MSQRLRGRLVPVAGALVATVALLIIGSGAGCAIGLAQAAREAVSARDFTRARELYRRLLQEQPANTEYMLWVARLSAWLKRFGPALEEYDRVLAREPQNADALIGKAYVLMWQHKFAPARALLDEAARVAPRSEDLRQARASLERYQHPPGAALSAAERKARDALAAHRLSEARDQYAALARRAPANLEYPLWVGRISGWMNDYAAAEQAYVEVLARDPGNLEALTGEAYVAMWQERFDQARQLLERAAQAGPDNFEVHLALARFYHYQDLDDRALAHLERALRAAPGNPEARALGRQLRPSRPLELRVGYEHDWFTFFTPGNIGSLSLGYIGKRDQLRLNYEAWDRFGKTAERAGASYDGRLGAHTYLRAGFLYAPGGPIVIPRQDYTVGVSQGLPGGLALGVDYRYLHFSTANVHILNPSIEYYLRRPIWLAARFYQNWTDFKAGGATSDQSFLLEYSQQVAEPLTIHLGYARGNESFSSFTADRLGQFTANTVYWRGELAVSQGLSLGMFYSYQLRSSGAELNSLGLSVTLRR